MIPIRRWAGGRAKGAARARDRKTTFAASEILRCAISIPTAREINWVFIRALLASVADTASFPLQDVLGLGTEARMNQPATLGGNWRWRYRAGALTPEITQRLGELTRLYER